MLREGKKDELIPKCPVAIFLLFESAQITTTYVVLIATAIDILFVSGMPHVEIRCPLMKYFY